MLIRARASMALLVTVCLTLSAGCGASDPSTAASAVASAGGASSAGEAGASNVGGAAIGGGGSSAAGSSGALGGAGVAASSAGSAGSAGSAAGSSGSAGVGGSSGNVAIVVALRAASNQDNNYMGGCFATGPNDKELTEVPYFDAVVSQIESALCVDKSKLFMEGYSSGSWLTNLLGCVRAGVLRGQGNATGGLPTVSTCAGPIAAMFAHDDTDDQNVIAEGMKARDRVRAINGCSDTTMPYEWDTNPSTVSTCVQYQGCKPGFPVIWCPTHGKGHSDQVPISTTGFWKFWSGLP